MQRTSATSKTKQVTAAALSITVAQFLKGFPSGVGKKLVQYLWVPARALGRDGQGNVVVWSLIMGSTSALSEGISLCLSRGGGESMKILAVGGLTDFGLKGVRTPQRRLGEIYLGDTPHALPVKVGKVKADWYPITLGDAIPGALVCVQERRNAQTPFVNRGKHLINRATPIMNNGTGLVSVYVGDLAFVRVDGVWHEYEVVPRALILGAYLQPDFD